MGKRTRGGELMKCKFCLERGEQEEDFTLELNVTEHHYQKFSINDDGTLEYIDSDADQIIYLECPLCGSKFEFDVDFENFALQMEKRYVMTRLDFSKYRCGDNPIVNLNDYKIVERGK